MAQQFDYPKTETQLREIQDALYQHSKEVYEAGGRPAFKGLLEIMSAESTIITAIHNIKGNHGSETPGVDSKTMRKDYLQKPFPWVVADIQRAFKHFEPQQIRRVYIDKPGKSETQADPAKSESLTTYLETSSIEDLEPSTTRRLTNIIDSSRAASFQQRSHQA